LYLQCLFIVRQQQHQIKIVHFSTGDEACVRTVYDDFRAGCERGQPGDEITFQFPSGAVDVGEDFYACFSGYDEKLHKRNKWVRKRA
jgi:hypothetical protein